MNLEIIRRTIKFLGDVKPTLTAIEERDEALEAFALTDGLENLYEQVNELFDVITDYGNPWPEGSVGYNQIEKIKKLAGIEGEKP